MIADFEAFYGYDADDEFENEGALAEILEQYEAWADCGYVLYCRDFILVPDDETNSVAVFYKPVEKHQLAAYLEMRQHFLEQGIAKHKVWDSVAFKHFIQ